MIRPLATLTVSVLLVVAASAQQLRTEIRTRIDAFTRALATGAPDAFEHMAQEHFTREALARRTPDERRGMIRKLAGAFGTMRVTGEISRRPGTVELSIGGDTRMRGKIILEFETAAPYRIAAMGIEIGDDEAPSPSVQQPPITASMADDQLAAVLDRWLAGLARSDDFAGVVLVARDGRVVFERGYGHADRAKSLLATPEWRFNLASIGKAFTQVAIGQLMSQGKLTLSDTVGTHLRDYPNPDARTATIEQLLNHRGGIADFFGPEFDAAPKEAFAANADYFRFVAPKPLLFPPGTSNQYCNGCYVVLGEIIAAISGTTYEQYIQKHVFEPARMSTAGFFSHDDTNVAPAYTRRRGDGKTPVSAVGLHGRKGSAAGGSFACAADLLAFDNAVRDGRLLDDRMTAWFFHDGQTEKTVAAGAKRAGGSIGIAGGAIGANAILEANGRWTVVVVGNLDPPNASRVGRAIHSALR